MGTILVQFLHPAYLRDLRILRALLQARPRLLRSCVEAPVERVALDLLPALDRVLWQMELAAPVIPAPVARLVDLDPVAQWLGLSGCLGRLCALGLP